MDRRLYRRENINIDSEFIHREAVNPAKREFFGRIADISECGVKITIENSNDLDIANGLAIGDTICFQAVDIYELFGVEHTELVCGEATILRKEETNGAISFGCRLKTISDELEHYIANKKVATFVDSGCTLVI